MGYMLMLTMVTSSIAGCARSGMQGGRRQPILRRILFSAFLHGTGVLLLVNWWWIAAHRMHPAGIADGTRIVLHYKPGKLAEPAQESHRVLRRRPAVPRRALPPSLAVPKLATAANAATDAPSPQAEAGDDARGDGSASLRYVQAFPDQRPDFSGQGATGDVVVDVQIDDTGRVERVFARKGMGAAIDAMVIATVQRWMFDPARKDGRAVSSVQELHFHYDRTWSRESCGWDCIGLMSQ